MSGPQFLHAAPNYGYLRLDNSEMTMIESKEDITADMDYGIILPRNPGIPLFDRKTLLMKLLTKDGNRAPYLDDLCNPAWIIENLLHWDRGYTGEKFPRRVNFLLDYAGAQTEEVCYTPEVMTKGWFAWSISERLREFVRAV